MTPKTENKKKKKKRVMTPKGAQVSGNPTWFGARDEDTPPDTRVRRQIFSKEERRDTSQKKKKKKKKKKKDPKAARGPFGVGAKVAYGARALLLTMSRVPPRAA